MRTPSVLRAFRILRVIIIPFIVGISVSGCEDDAVKNRLIFKFKFDPEQVRLNNFGRPSTVPDGNAAQTPSFNTISAHYIELVPDATTPLGEGLIVYQSDTTLEGGENAIDFSKSVVVPEGEEFISVPIDADLAGTYKYIRVSLSYQNYDIALLLNGFQTGATLASFVGYNTFISTFTIKEEELTVNANKKQGFWAFESQVGVVSGQAPEGATTVPNPLAATSPIPAGSCVVTGEFATPFTIAGNESSDIQITLSVSINKSFEWKEVLVDGAFDPSIGEKVVDMGLRGLIPIVE